MKPCKVTGRVSSFQSLGAVDGPGIRFVVFLQGCPLRCIYCHNPETWDMQGGTEMTADEVFSKIRKYRNYFGKNGGVTVSGGEALLQIEFVEAIFSLCREAGIHTALDTSGTGCQDDEKLENLLGLTDLVICDLKFVNEEDYVRNTGGSFKQVLHFLDLAGKHMIPVWIRQVIVPGINDDEEFVKKLNEISMSYENVERVELLAFRNLCIPKYEKLGINFRLRDTPQASEELISRLYEFIEKKSI